jgi:Protein of unknown function (DUF1592)/Protein of unknown function (DUF1588)
MDAFLFPLKDRPFVVVCNLMVGVSLFFCCEGRVGSIQLVGGGNDGPGLPSVILPEGVTPVEGAPSDFKPPIFECDQSQPFAGVPLRRLSKVQYLNALDSVMQNSNLPADEMVKVRAALDAKVASLPGDSTVGFGGAKHGGFSRNDQSIQNARTDATYEIAIALGKALTETPARIATVVGTCATDVPTENDAQCLKDFIVRFGSLVLRKPLLEDDQVFYADVAKAGPVDADNLADVIALLLLSPHFMYQVEEGTLDAYALASKLSFHFWQSPPDKALTAAAASGALMTEPGYLAQVERLSGDDRTVAAMREFFFDWFRLGEVPALHVNVGDRAYDTLLGELKPTAALQREMRDEVLEAASSLLRDNGSVASLVTDRRFVTQSATLAQVYGQAAWNGIGSPPVFQSKARSGLLTRAAFLATGNSTTRPIIKGFLIRNALLCQELGLPPPEAVGIVIRPEADATTRQRVEAVTSPGKCAGCHQTQLNPLGFASENFDPVGRERTQEMLFSIDGELMAQRAVDTRNAPHVAGMEQQVGGIDAVSRLMVSGGEFQTCFAKQYFRFTFQRDEQEKADGCVLKKLQSEALAGKPMREVLKAAALQREFKLRGVQ